MTDPQPDFWLGERSEYEITDFDGRLRRCYVLDRLTSEPTVAPAADGSAPTLLRVRLDPPLVLDGDEHAEVVLQARHSGNDVGRLGDASISVYVCEIRPKEGVRDGHVAPSSLHLLTWADVARDPAFLPPTQEEGFDQTFELLRHYADREGNPNAPLKHHEGDVPLGNWVWNIKRSQARGELRADWVDRLAALPGWQWGVDADRDWSEAAAGYGLLWLMAPEQGGTIGLDRRMRLCHPVDGRPPIDDPDGRPSLWASAYPTLELQTEQPGMLVITASNPVEDLRELTGGPVIVELSHIATWRRLPSGTRRPDEVLRLGLAVVAHDPALLPPMSDEEWEAGLVGLRTYRQQIGHCWVPVDYVPKGDPASVIHLGGWALRVRSEHRRRALATGRAERLESIPDWHWSLQA